MYTLSKLLMFFVKVEDELMSVSGKSVRITYYIKNSSVILFYHVYFFGNYLSAARLILFFSTARFFY